MKILITGITGYVGSHLAEKLHEDAMHEVYGIVRTESSDLPSSITQIVINDSLEKSVKNINPDAVIHLASYLTANSSWQDIENLISTNIQFSTKILDTLRDTDCKYFINVGTFAEYHYSDGELIPTYVYAATKTAFRSMLKYYSGLLNFKTIHVIPYTIYGGAYKQKKVLDLLFQSLDANETLKFSPGTQKLDFVHIDDVCSFFLTLLDSLNVDNEQITNGETFHLGTGKAYSIKEVAALIENLTDRKANIAWGALKQRERDTIYACAPVGKNSDILKWSAKTDLKDALLSLYNRLYLD